MNDKWYMRVGLVAATLPLLLIAVLGIGVIFGIGDLEGDSQIEKTFWGLVFAVCPAVCVVGLWLSRTRPKLGVGLVVGCRVLVEEVSRCQGGEVSRAPNLTRALKSWADAGLQVIGLDAEGDTTVDEFEGTGPLVLVVGSEGKGLSRLVRENCDAVVSIPMAGPTESLNASVAAGVVLAEIARQRRG